VPLSVTDLSGNNIFLNVIIGLNGTKITSSPYTEELSTGESPLIIGWGFDGPEYYHFNGIIDEVKIYNRALSEKEIQDHFKELGGKITTSTPIPATSTPAKNCRNKFKKFSLSFLGFTKWFF
ncbi:MAG TPA: hypothetical protein P5150_04470, partial [Candidatus Ratteibacteria bacterium]|nr:hypothetical protein [Candidatus Ratteibacteria bacterium]